MTYPTIHLNGTNGDDLISSLCDALHAIEAAEKALAATSPHGRDYYVQPSGAFYKAQDEHFLRLSRLHEIHKELGLIVENVCEQQDAYIAEIRGGVR